MSENAFSTDASSADRAPDPANAASRAAEDAVAAESTVKVASSEAEAPQGIESLSENVRKSVTTLTRGDTTWHIIGTAHVSQESVNDVRAVIEAVQPDTVAIELCDTRYSSLTDENRWEKLNIFEVIREGKTLMLLANLAIGAYQRRIGAQLGVKPGAEMIEAAKIAEDTGATLYLADRNIQITLKRTWQNIGFFKRMALLGGILDSLTGGGDVDAETIEDLKEAEQLSSMLETLAEELPEVKGPLIDERDLYMVSKLREAPGKTIVAVVGAGHVPGMIKHFDDTIDRASLTTLKPPSKWVNALKWAIPVAVLLAFVWGFMQHGQDSLQSLITAWVLPNVIFASLLTLLAGGKFPTIVVAGIASPITSLNPLLNVGMPVGFCEAWLRKPTVADAERIADDVQSIKGFYKNAFTRTLLVTVASILGSALGAWVGIGWMGSIFASVS